MTVQFKGTALFACLALASVLSVGCSGDSGTSNTDPTTGKISLTLTRNSKPVVGMQVILQKESDQTEIGSGLSNAAGQIATSEFTGTAMATFVDATSTQNFLFTMRDLKAGANLNVELPSIIKAKIGAVQFTPPTDYPGATNYEIYIPTSNEASQTYLSPPLVPAVTPQIIAA